LSRQKYLIEKQMLLLESKIQVAIGARCGMKGVASWKWVERWTMYIERLKKEQDDPYKSDSSALVFRLERVDLT